MEILFFMYGVKYLFIDNHNAFKVVTVFIFIMHYILDSLLGSVATYSLCSGG